MNGKPSIVSIMPEHPPRQRSASTIGQLTREDGARSRIRISIDTGLKSGKLTTIEMTPREAMHHLAALATAIDICLRVNAEERDRE